MWVWRSHRETDTRAAGTALDKPAMLRTMAPCLVQLLTLLHTLANCNVGSRARFFKAIFSLLLARLTSEMGVAGEAGQAPEAL